MLVVVVVDDDDVDNHLIRRCDVRRKRKKRNAEIQRWEEGGWIIHYWRVLLSFDAVTGPLSRTKTF